METAPFLTFPSGSHFHCALSPHLGSKRIWTAREEAGLKVYIKGDGRTIHLGHHCWCRLMDLCSPFCLLPSWGHSGRLESQYKLEDGPAPTMLWVELCLLDISVILKRSCSFFNGTLDFPCAKLFYSWAYGMAKPSACDWNFHGDKTESGLLTVAKSNFPQHPVSIRAEIGESQVNSWQCQCETVNPDASR